MEVTSTYGLESAPQSSLAVPNSTPVTSTPPSPIPPPSVSASPQPRDEREFEPLGDAHCNPPSPYKPWPNGDKNGSGIVEIRGTASEMEMWGLVWETPPLIVNREIKMVWRVTGAGGLKVHAMQGTQEAELTWGPVEHGASTFARNGDEWGTAFRFGSPGCWDIIIERGGAIGHVWLKVSAG